MGFSKTYDVVVAGGGVAGVAAALAAARRGARTALVEKTVIFGGLATTGLIYIYLPLCDGNGTQVSFGITEEMLIASLKYGPNDIPSNWSREKDAVEEKRYRVQFSPASFAIALDEMLSSAGVDVWLDTVVRGVKCEDGRVSAIEVCNKSGDGELRAGCFVDATGDADLAHFAGMDCPVGDNAMALWAIEYNRNECRERYYLGDNVHMYYGGSSNDARMGKPGINGKLVSEFVMAGREKYRKRLEEGYAKGEFDRSNRFPLTLPSMAQFRMTRRIKGLYNIEPGCEWTHFDDSIGIAADWRKPGWIWETPYRSLLPQGIKNLLAAGRCMDTVGDVWDVYRVIPVAALTGEAAGVAAAMSAERGISPDALPCGELQRELREKNQFRLHFEDVGLKARKRED